MSVATRRELLEKTKALRDEVLQTDFAHFLRDTPSNRNLDMETLRADVAEATKHLRRASNELLEGGPDSTIGGLYHQCERLQKWTRKMDVNNVHTAAEVYNQAATEIGAAREQTQLHLAILLALSLGSSIDELVEGMRAQYADATQRLAVGQQEIQRATSDVQRVLDEAKASATLLTVSAHAKFFSKSAKTWETASWRWFVAILLLSFAAGLFAWLLPQLVTINSDEQTGIVVQKLAARLIPLSLSLYVLTLFIRNYRAARHMAALDAHRARALETFDSILNVTDDKDTKNACLLEAARCIFSPGQTGYLPGSDDDGGPSRMLEIVKLIGGKQ